MLKRLCWSVDCLDYAQLGGMQSTAAELNEGSVSKDILCFLGIEQQDRFLFDKNNSKVYTSLHMVVLKSVFK